MARDSTKQKLGDPAKAPLSVPSKFVGTDWADMIDIANRARAFGKDTRAGKPKTFKKYPRPTIR